MAVKRTVALLPSWSYPLILVLLAIVLTVGGLSPLLQMGVGVVSVLFLVYMVVRSYRRPRENHAVANLLPLFPGHLLLLFALSLLPEVKTYLVLLWMIIPLTSILYDLTATWPLRSERARRLTLAGLYSILWTVVFILLERIIALGRGLQGAEQVKLAIAFSVAGVLFLSVGIYRHWHAGKIV
ncbi:hypothetical protein LR032_04630 [Candidatus Bipolaricaulota bacterium]|nr:hypothetical protein [Candidatus Bipolaricaulota bacterium]